MSSYVRSPRATDRPTGREETEGTEEEAIMLMAVQMPPRPTYMAAAHTTDEAAGAEATATALDMVDTSRYCKTKSSARYL